MNLDQVIALEKSRFAALVSGDLQTLETMLDDQVAYTHTNGIFDTKASLLGSIRSGVRKYLAFDCVTLTGTAFGTTFVLNGRSAIRYEARGNVVSAEIAHTSVWRADGATARLIAWHSSPATCQK